MTLLEKPMLWITQQETPFDAGVQQEYWELLQLTAFGRDRAGGVGRRIFDQVVELGTQQIDWTRQQQPFLFTTWEGGMSGGLKQSGLVYGTDQLVLQYEKSAKYLQGIDRLFLRSQIVGGLMRSDEHDDLFFSLINIDKEIQKR